MKIFVKNFQVVFGQKFGDELQRDLGERLVLAKHVEVLAVHQVLLVLGLLGLDVTVLKKLVFHFIND